MIKYKTFGASDTFEAWQKERTRQIIQIVPIALNINVEARGNQEATSAVGDALFGIMVIYKEE